MDKTDSLSISSNTFKKSSKQLSNKLWWTNVKVKIGVTLLIAVRVFVIVIIVMEDHNYAYALAKSLSLTALLLCEAFMRMQLFLSIFCR